MKKLFFLFVILTLIFSLPTDSEAKKKKKTKPPATKQSTPVPPTSVPSATLPDVSWPLTIFGQPVATQEQAVNFIKKSNPNIKINCSLEELVSLYYREGRLEGIRPDLALSQALLETGFFRYGGDVKPEQNNFCGLGSVGGGVKGATFATPEIGVRAHIQHLLAYASKKPPQTTIVDPRYTMITKLPHIFGVCKTWDDLDGRWAKQGVPYGARVRSIYERMLQTEPFNKPIPAEPKNQGDAKPEPKNQKKKSGGTLKERIEDILKDK